MSKEEIKQQKLDDHDLLIKLSVQLDDLIEKVEKMGQKPIADPIQVADHEARLRRVERWGITAIGALAAVEFFFNYLK